MKQSTAIILAAIVGVFAYFVYQDWKRTQDTRPIVIPVPVKPIIIPQPKPRPQPAPCPGPGPCPPRGAVVGGRINADGTAIQADLPGERHVKNRGGSDGAGLCVFASMRHTGDWQNEPVFYNAFEHMFKYPGGGYPEKVKQVVSRIAKEKGIPEPEYLQVEDNDLEVLKLACKNGYMPGVTYSFSPTGRYSGQRISHMVNLVAATDKWFVILDNNYPGDESYEWLTPEEFSKVYSGGRQGWAVILLRNAPSPAPRNLKGGN